MEKRKKRENAAAQKVQRKKDAEAFDKEIKVRPAWCFL